MSKKKNIVRAGDVVRLKPGARERLVVRVGYPKTTKDYLPQAIELLRPAYKAANLHLREDGGAVYQVARDIGYNDHFGGRTRMLHFGEYKGARDTFTVHEVVTRYTGEKYDPINSGGYDPWTGEYDYDFEPGGIADAKAHRIAIPNWDKFWLQNNPELLGFVIKEQLGKYLGFLVGDLEKVEEDS